MKRITKDFETRSACNLKIAGAYKYSLDPTTQPTCFAFKEHGAPTVYFLDFQMVNTHWRKLPEKLKRLWTQWINEDYEFSAHNSFFERCIYDNIMVPRYGWPPIRPRLRRCTAAKAAACALPRNLEGAGEAMELKIQKDKRGYLAMMATCKPTRQYNAWKRAVDEVSAGKKVGLKKKLLAQSAAPKMFLEPEDAPEVWSTLYTYCKIDVRAEEQLDISLPDLSPAEQEIWFLNQKLNWRGLRFDKPTVEKVVSIMEVENKKKIKELDTLTMGLIQKPGALKSILEFLELDGITLPNLRAKTLDDALSGFALTDDARQLLEIRKALSMSSTKKYLTFLNRAVGDRVRDILMYHAASTGRDGGQGIQPHNFPRGLLKVTKGRPYAHVENVVECEVELLKILYGENLGILFSAILRNMIIPDDGHEIFVADFSKIEVAVLWWLAGNKKGLEILLSGKDPYIYQAAVNLSKSYEEIEQAVDAEEKWALDARQLGKAQILGCGFGMGWSKFQTTGWDQYRLKLSDEQSKKAVMSYREANDAVPQLWEAYENAAICAVENPGRKYFAGKCTFEVYNGFLWAKLPSGRSLPYRRPQVAWRARQYDVKTVKIVNGKEVETIETKWTQPKKTLEYWAVNSKTKKWNLERNWGGGLTENMVQATARDLMMPAMVRLEKKHYQALLMVHDEGITQKKIGTGDVEEFVKIMTELPPWAKGLPLEAKGWKGPRYRK